jgi:hypothetical protein
MSIHHTADVGTLIRSDARRNWWGHLVAWVAEARSHRVFCLVCGIWLLNAFDLLLTLLSYEQGVLHEQNPLARQMLQNGVPSIALYKVGLVLIGTYPLLKFRTARIAELASIVVLLAYAALSLRWSSCYELYVAAFSGGADIAELGLSSGVTPH